ncbi:DMT family transporter [Cognatazoarcus halotolerans]|uniref:DMT family transporter n=1 Tax=Cognatazoarcus halotolerans TaxID=2686016 RepID=UPI0013583F1C|nr:EamA family transporter [Cognatazoarcus halotolerans]MCB1897898.1 EamA family transporter [Rhodocyclaceae bacterium]MCP5310588.1 EamA family transporter [Zoogloeaceae bacterium]
MSQRPGLQASPWLALHLAVLLFGTAGLFARGLSISSINLVFARTAIAAIALALVWRFGAAARGRQTFGWWLLLTGPLLAIHWASFFHAIQVASVAIGLLGYASFPLFSVSFAWLAGERPRRSDLLGAGAVSVGLVLLVPQWSIDNSAVQGLIWGLLSGATFAALTMVNRRQVGSVDPVALGYAQNAVAALCLLPWVSWPIAAGGVEWGALLALGLVWTALSHTLFITALRAVPAQEAAVVASLEPVYGIALAWYLFGEAPGAREWIGGAMIVGVSVWLTWTRRGERRRT